MSQPNRSEIIDLSARRISAQGVTPTSTAVERRGLDDDSGGAHDENMSDDMTRHEVTARLEASEARVATSVESMRADSSGLRADMRSEMTELRADMREGFSLLRVDIEKVRADSHKASMDITRWIMATVVTIGLGFVGLILTGAGFYLRYLATQS